jgi:hypothetical protein
MWQNYETNGADFDIADDPDEAAQVAARRNFEHHADKFGLCNSAEINGLGGDPEEDELLAEAMQNT